MKISKKSLRLVAVITYLCLSGVAQAVAADSRILFIGNSYCDYNVLNGQIAAMIASRQSNAVAERQTTGGFSLEKHWQSGKAQQRIEGAEEWDIIVLQNHSRSALDQRKSFDEYGQKFIDLVKQSGAEPILYMTWARQNIPEDQAVIAEAYSSLGNKNNIKVAPVGLAFEEWIKAHPDIALHIHDHSHPTTEGSYLAACVIYATISGESPVGLPNIIEGQNWVNEGKHLAYIDPTRTQRLQEIAWSTVQAYSPEKHASDKPLKSTNASSVANAQNLQASDSDIRINFGGTAIPGWNKVGGAQNQPLPLLNADGKQSGASIQIVDDFETYENPNAVGGTLTGEAVVFEGAKSATLYNDRAKGNPTGAVQFSLDPSKAYTLRLWASRAAGGKRWGKYTVTGITPETQFLAAGGNSGNLSNVLTFSNVIPDPSGRVTVSVDFPNINDTKRNHSGYTYLTGIILLPNS